MARNTHRRNEVERYQNDSGEWAIVVERTMEVLQRGFESEASAENCLDGWESSRRSPLSTVDSSDTVKVAQIR